MVTVIGASGNVGYATARTLREAGTPVRVVLHERASAAKFEASDFEIAYADLHDRESLVRAIDGTDAVQIVVPLRPKTPDPVEDMRLSMTSLIAALEKARPSRILAISDYGAHVSADIGMPTIFHELEERLRRLGGRKTILRSAEHMHVLAPAIAAALESGALMTFQDPLGMAHPTVAAPDVGRISAELLLCDQADDVAIVHAEGPRRYSASETASILGELTGRKIEARLVPRAAWQTTLQAKMPPSLASLLIRTNEAKNEGGLVEIDARSANVRYGKTELIDALRPLVPG